MRTVAPFALTACLSAGVFLSGCSDQEALAPAGETPRPSRTYRIQEILGSTGFSGASFSPDATKILVSSDATGIFNAYSIPVRGGEPVALTHSTEESIRAVSYFPADERFLYSTDRGGNERSHIYVRELDGTVTDLTPGEDTKAAFLQWSQGEDAFFLLTTERDPRFFDLYEYSVRDYHRERLYQNDAGMDLAAISPDRRSLVLGRRVTNADSDLYLHDLLSGATRLLTDDDEAVANSAMGFSRDGRFLYYTTDLAHDFRYLARLELETGETEVVEKTDWEVMSVALSHSGAYLLTSVNVDARTELRLYETATMERVSLPELPDAEVGTVAIARDDKNLAFYSSSGRMPRDLFHARIGEAAATRLTSSLDPAIDPADLVEGLVERFASYDGLEIPGILYRPHRASVTNPVPALVWVHGGPGGQSRVGYSGLIQYLVNHGYAVYAINNRGSSGYGKTFFHLDDRKHGDADLDDVVASKAMLAATGWIDPQAIGIIGGSYGGYMILAALTFRPDEFAVGIDLYGISNWYRTVQNTPPWWEAIRASLVQEMGDFDDEEFFNAKSPLFHAANIRKPLMVLQGANDPRVLKVESDEIVAAARANGVPVEYVLFDDEGHGFVKKENQERAYESILRFCDRYLRRPIDALVGNSEDEGR